MSRCWNFTGLAVAAVVSGCSTVRPDTHPPQACVAPAVAPAIAPTIAPTAGNKAKRATRTVAPQLRPAAPVVAADTDRKGGVEVTATPWPVSAVLGAPVHDAAGADLGRLVDVLADAEGRVRLAVIDFGGFLGVGDRRIAVSWPLLRFNPGSANAGIVLRVAREQLRNAPHYKDSRYPEALLLDVPGNP